MKEFKFFKLEDAKTTNAKHALAIVELLCIEKKDGIELAIEELLEACPDIDAVGLTQRTFFDYDEDGNYYEVDYLEIETNPAKIEMVVCADKANNHTIAELICKAQGIDSDFIGGQENGYIHISTGSRRCPEGYTLGYCL